MAVSHEDLLKALKNVREPLETTITNARLRRVLRRVRNEGEGEDIEGFAEDELEEVEDGAEVGVGDVVEVEIPRGTTVTAKVVDTEPQEEIVEETEVVEPDFEEEEGDGDVVENRRQYRRVKNARIIRTKNGSLDVLVPVEGKSCCDKGCGGRKKVTNVRRRYKVRSTRNAGYDPETAYAKKIPSDGIDSFATVVNKARKYDRLVANATIDAAIDEAIKKALQQNGITNRSIAPKKVQPTRMNKVRNYRRFFNDDEEDAGVPVVSDAPFVDEDQNAIVIPLSDTEMTALADELNDATEDAGEGDAPVADDVVSENARRILNRRRFSRIRNSRQIRNSRIKNAMQRNQRMKSMPVRNEESEILETPVDTNTNVVDMSVNNAASDLDFGLDIPSTFPNK